MENSGDSRDMINFEYQNLLDQLRQKRHGRNTDGIIVFKAVDGLVRFIHNHFKGMGCACLV